MHAAIVTEFDHAPRYGAFEEPHIGGEHDEIVDVIAAALHPRVRSQANGSHYSSGAELPIVPGIDGVGRRADGTFVYFVLPDTRFGSMAKRVVIDARRSIELPEGADPVAVAAAMNPAMSSWVALRRRASLQPGQSVLVLGATGSAVQLAVQVAKHLGAGRVVAAGRDAATLESLTALGADALVSLAGDPDDAAARVGLAAAEVDVVVDYLWGEPTQRLMPALLTRRTDPARPLAWVEVGAVAGPEITIASAWLRGANVSLMGSGQGSVSARGIVEELVPLVAEAGSFALHTDLRRLETVEATWTEPANARRRIVFSVG